jgi:hypothetical protein
VRIPWVADGSAQGYLTGAVTIAAETAAGTTATAPFTITPAVYQGDAVADAKALVSAIAANSKAALEQQKQVSDLAVISDNLETYVDQHAAIFNKMLSDIAASGTASVPYDVATPTNPTPQPVTVTRADIQNFMRLANRYGLTPGDFTAAAENTREASLLRPRASSGPCLSSDHLYKFWRLHPSTRVILRRC